MYLLGRTQMVPAATFEESVKRLMEKGFDGVEINIYNLQFQLREEFFAAGFADRMKDILAKYHVKAFSVGAHRDYTDEEDFEIVSQAIRVAADLGAPPVIITGAFRNEEIPFEEQWKLQIQKTKELCKVAEAEGIRLALEFEPGFVIDSTEKMLKAFAEINSPVLKVNADIGHMFLQDQNPMKSIELCGQYIIHAHVENMAKGIHNHLVPYEGDMDLPAYIKKLRETGFDGCASLDVYQYDYESIAEASVHYLRSIM